MRIALSFLFIAAFFFSGWSVFIAYRNTSAKPADTGKPDAFMEDIVATVIDKEGEPKLKIIASKMMHYLENDMTEIANPQLILYRKSPQPWHLTANYAKTLQGLSQINLRENIVIHHPGDPQNEQTTLLTPTLIIYPDKQFATTLDPVTIHQPHTEIHAIGMNADLASGTIKLLSQIQGEYYVFID